MCLRFSHATALRSHTSALGRLNLPTCVTKRYGLPLGSALAPSHCGSVVRSMVTTAIPVLPFIVGNWNGEEKRCRHRPHKLRVGNQ
jgi:hypothetical protein